MTEPLRVAHYLNQFFAGIGGEERAGVGVSTRPEPVGPGRALQAALGDAARIVGTVICGDNHVAEREEAAVAAMRRELEALRPAVLVAGRPSAPAATASHARPPAAPRPRSDVPR
jgi:glycine reductase